jgi:hypothetical protein
MNVDLAAAIIAHALQHSNFYVPGSFGEGDMFGNNQSSAASGESLDSIQA